MMIILNTDGGARGNPGPAGIGAVIFADNKKVVATASKYIGKTTNNEAEYQAVILGLDLIKKNFSVAQIKSAEVELRVDSELIARQLAGKYKVKEERLRVYHTKIKEMLKTDFPNFKITEIRREQNELADQLANEAMDEAN